MFCAKYWNASLKLFLTKAVLMKTFLKQAYAIIRFGVAFKEGDSFLLKK